MKIYSYNVNGIRAAMRKNLIHWINNQHIDILCLQEIKAMESQIDIKTLEDNGFKYNYFFSAQKKGYSGVAILSKYIPNHVEIGTGIKSIDVEGRVIRIDFNDFSIISLYVPSGTNPKRLDFKINFCDIFLNYILKLKKTIPNLIILGDYNICHKEIDIYDPINSSHISGFLPIERKWLSNFIEKCGMIDSFREFNKKSGNYSWWSYRTKARNYNKGWRIDYAMISISLIKKLQNAGISYEANHSDHCPIWISIK